MQHNGTLRYNHKYAYVLKHLFNLEAMIDKVLLRLGQKTQDRRRNGIILTQQGHIRDSHVHKKPNKCK